MTWVFWSPCFHLPRVQITDVGHQALLSAGSFWCGVFHCPGCWGSWLGHPWLVHRETLQLWHRMILGLFPVPSRASFPGLHLSWMLPTSGLFPLLSWGCSVLCARLPVASLFRCIEDWLQSCCCFLEPFQCPEGHYLRPHSQSDCRFIVLKPKP